MTYTIPQGGCTTVSNTLNVNTTSDTVTLNGIRKGNNLLSWDGFPYIGDKTKPSKSVNEYIDYFSLSNPLEVSTKNYNFSISTFDNMIKQVKVAVFKVSRNDKGVITDTEFIKELWVQVKNNSSVDLAVAKALPDLEVENTIIKEIYSVTF